MTNYVVPQEVKHVKDPLDLLTPLDKTTVVVGLIFLVVGVAVMVFAACSEFLSPEAKRLAPFPFSIAALVGAVQGVAYPIASKIFKKKHGAKFNKAIVELQAHLKNEQLLTASFADCRKLLLGATIIFSTEKGITKHVTLDRETSVFKMVTVNHAVTEETFGGHHEAIESTSAKAEPTKVLPDKLFVRN